MGRKKFLVLAVALVMLFGFSQVAGASYATYAGKWVSTDNDTSALTISSNSLASGWTFGVFDIDGSSPNYLGLIDNVTTSSSFKVSGTTLTVLSGLPAAATTLSLTNSLGWFGFYFYDGSNYYTSYSMEDQGGGNTWNLGIGTLAGFSDGSGGPVLVNDASPVPLPTSALFLFSGILGLVAFGSRKKIMH